MIGDKGNTSTQTYGRGFSDLIAGDSKISRIDGQGGRLWYRGYRVEELCECADFEEVAYLILHGELPTVAEYSAWTDELLAWRELPPEALSVLLTLPIEAHPLMKYRTMLSVAACLIPEGENSRIDAQWKRPARILSWTAGLAAAAIRHMNGKPPVPADDKLGFAQNFLWQALGKLPSEDQQRAFEVSLIAQAEHGLHAAALASLIVISTGADLGSAVLAGMGALSGQLHGGANQHAFELFQSIKDRVDIPKWTKDKINQNYRFPGFGHRVYKTVDPRVKILEPWAKKLLKASDRTDLWEVFQTMKHEIEVSLGSKGIFANVDSVTGLVYYPIGLPVESFPIPFALAIQVGWMAHCLEYIPNGKMIEPGAIYLENS